MTEAFGPGGPKSTPYRIIRLSPEDPILSRIIEVSPEELEDMQIGADGLVEPNPRYHGDADSPNHHTHYHFPDVDVDHSSGATSGAHHHEHPH